MYIESYGEVNGHRAVRESLARRGMSYLELSQETGMPIDRLIEGNCSSIYLNLWTEIDDDKLYELAHD